MGKPGGSNLSKQWGGCSLIILVGAIVWCFIWGTLSDGLVQHPVPMRQGPLFNADGLGERLMAQAGTALVLIMATVAATIGVTRTDVDRRLSRVALAVCLASWILLVFACGGGIDLFSGLGALRGKPAAPAGPVPAGDSMRRDTL